jgi:hypothetical protein
MPVLNTFIILLTQKVLKLHGLFSRGLLNSFFTFQDVHFFLYNFLIITGKWSGFLNGKLICSLPKLANKKWTDKAIYKHFNLTQEEIDYVEANFK